MSRNTLSDMLRKAPNREAAIRVITAHFKRVIVLDTLTVKFDGACRTASYEHVSGGTRHGLVNMDQIPRDSGRLGEPGGISCPGLQTSDALVDFVEKMTGAVALA